MKSLLAATVLLSAFAVAQQQPPAAPPPVNRGAVPTAEVTEHLVPATKSDTYCSGFISSTPVSRANFIAGGLETPDKVRYTDRDYIFISGSNLTPGSRVSIVREWRNPDHVQPFKEANKMLAKAGQPYEDLGYARIIENRGTNIAVAQVEFSCEAIIPGDIAVPFMPRPEVKVRPQTTLDRFPPALNSLKGNIIMASGGDQVIASGTKVYLNVGSQDGARTGSYFRVTRGYSPEEMDSADRVSIQSSEFDDTQMNAKRLPTSKLGELPRRVIGEVVILNAMPTTSTAMVTFTLEEMHPGDVVDMEPAEASAGGSN